MSPLTDTLNGIQFFNIFIHHSRALVLITHAERGLQLLRPGQPACMQYISRTSCFIFYQCSICVVLECWHSLLYIIYVYAHVDDVIDWIKVLISGFYIIEEKKYNFGILYLSYHLLKIVTAVMVAIMNWFIVASGPIGLDMIIQAGVQDTNVETIVK